jgi:hypothetical protein
VARGEQTYIQWKESRSVAMTQASRPSITVQTVTAFAAGAGLSAADLTRVQIETVSRAGIDRPGGRRFGALVHAVLAAVNLDAGPDEIGEVAEANGRLIGAARGEIDAAAATPDASRSLEASGVIDRRKKANRAARGQRAAMSMARPCSLRSSTYWASGPLDTSTIDSEWTEFRKYRAVDERGKKDLQLRDLSTRLAFVGFGRYSGNAVKT